MIILLKEGGGGEVPWFPKHCINCAGELGMREDELCEECRGNRIRANRAMRPPVELAREPAIFSQGANRETHSP